MTAARGPLTVVVSGGRLACRSARRLPCRLEPLQVVAPHEDFPPRTVDGQTTIVNVPADAHDAQIQLGRHLLDGQQRSLSHAPKGSQSDYQDNTYFERSGSVYSKYVFLKEEPMALESCTHEIRDLDTIRGGTRQYVEGLCAFVAGRDEDDLSVEIWAFDRVGLAAALRRAANEIEGIRQSPFNLPPVTVPMGLVQE